MSPTSTTSRTRTFDGGPRHGQTEPLSGPARDYITPDGAPVREADVNWTVAADGITHHGDVYGRECGAGRGARTVRYVWSGRE